MLAVQGKDKPRLQASKHLLFKKVTMTTPGGVDGDGDSLYTDNLPSVLLVSIAATSATGDLVAR